MRIHYLTHDVVNYELASQMAPSGITIVWRSHREPLTFRTADAFIYDLDHIPQQLRRQVSQELINEPPVVPVAVHSYCLPIAEAKAVRSNGVRVYRRLEPSLLEGFLVDAPHISRGYFAIDASMKSGDDIAGRVRVPRSGGYKSIPLNRAGPGKASKRARSTERGRSAGK